MANNWAETIDRYIREGRTVSGGCGESAGMKAAVSTATSIANSAASEASSIFGAASTVFNNLIGGIQRIVQGGPGQQGYSQPELNAMNAQAIQSGATLARNVEGAVGAGEGAIGGGNAVTPSGGTVAATTQAQIAAATQTANTLNQITQNNYAQGNQNYEEAVGQEENLPSVFGTSVSATNAATGASSNEVNAQKIADTENNWWQPMVTAAIGGASSALTGGLMNSMSSGSSGFNEFANPSDTITMNGAGGVTNPEVAAANQVTAPNVSIGMPGTIPMPNLG